MGRSQKGDRGVIARRTFLAGMASLTSAALATPARAAAAGRDIVLFIFRDIDFMRTDNALPGIADTLRRGTSFSNAFSATASPLAALPVLRSGLYAHQLGQRGGILSPWPTRGATAPTYDDLLKSLGYSVGRFETAMTKEERRAGIRALLTGRANVCAEFEVRAKHGHDASAALRTADALLSALPRIWQAQRRGPPLILLAGTGAAVDAAHAIEQPIGLSLTGPGRPGGDHNSALVNSVDIVPTLLDWAGGASLAASLPGRSLLQLSHMTPAPDDAVFAGHDNFAIGHFAPVRAIRTADFRLVHRMPRGGGIRRDPQAIAFYNLREDPDCKINLIGREKYRQHAARLEERLGRHRRETGDPLQSI